MKGEKKVRTLKGLGRNQRGHDKKKIDEAMLN